MATEKITIVRPIEAPKDDETPPDGNVAPPVSPPPPSDEDEQRRIAAEQDAARRGDVRETAALLGYSPDEIALMSDDDLDHAHGSGLHSEGLRGYSPVQRRQLRGLVSMGRYNPNGGLV